MTSNLGSHLIMEKFEGLTEGNKFGVLYEVKKQVTEMLKQHLRPEFLNRIDEAIVFSPLDEIDLHRIVKIQTVALSAKLAEMGVKLSFSDEAINHLAKAGFDPQFGARPVKRVIQKEIVNALSKEILAGTIHRNSEIRVGVEKGTLAFQNLAAEEA